MEVDPYMNSIRINLGTKNVIIFALAIQIALLTSSGLSQMGIHISGMRQIAGFLYLSFIPGLLILHILKLRVGSIETILYSVGLSLFFVMFVGAAINFLYPLIGISQPISEIPLIVTFGILTFTQVILCYLCDKDYLQHFFIDKDKLLSSSALFFLLLPILAILGALLVNYYRVNVLLLLLLLAISLVPILVAFEKIQQQIFPLAVWTIGLALLLHNSLVSKYLIDFDLHTEYYLANLVVTKSFWNTSIPNNINAMLSVIMLAPILSIVCDVDLVWVFKVIYPLLFSLVPLGLYQVFRTVFNEQIAFFSCFFFVSVSTFFTEMLGLARQQVAGFFLLLLILLMVDKSIKVAKRIVMAVIFSFSLVVSHYGLSYIFMFSLPLLFILFILFSIKAQERRKKKELRLVSSNFIFLYIVFALLWYTSFSSSSAFNTIVRLGYHIISSLSELFSPAAGGLEYLTKEFTIARQISRFLFLLYNFFIGIGIIDLLRSKKLDCDYNVFSVVFFGWGLASMSVPYLAHGQASIGLTRLYITLLTTLAPFSVLGGMAVAKYFSVRVKVKDRVEEKFLKIFALSLTIFLLLNSGFISETIIKDFRSSPVSSKYIIENGSISEKNIFYGLYPVVHDVLSAQWLSKYRKDGYLIYADRRAIYNVLTSYGMMGTPELNGDLRWLRENAKVDKDAYIYLRYFNNVDQVISDGLSPDAWWSLSKISYLLEKGNKVYSNGGSVIYYVGS